MKFRILMIIGIAFGLAACAEKEQAAPPVEVDEAETAVESAVESAAEEMPAEEREEMGTADFVAHMHHHASQLDRLKAALEIESLAAAQRPAYWLAGHDGVSGIPDEWRQYVLGMRDAANAVADATDIETARAAAKRIEEGCAGCHTAAGVDIDITTTE